MCLSICLTLDRSPVQSLQCHTDNPTRRPGGPPSAAAAGGPLCPPGPRVSCGAEPGPWPGRAAQGPEPSGTSSPSSPWRAGPRETGLAGVHGVGTASAQRPHSVTEAGRLPRPPARALRGWKRPSLEGQRCCERPAAQRPAHGRPSGSQAHPTGPSARAGGVEGPPGDLPGTRPPPRRLRPAGCRRRRLPAAGRGPGQRRGARRGHRSAGPGCAASARPGRAGAGRPAPCSCNLTGRLRVTSATATWAGLTAREPPPGGPGRATQPPCSRLGRTPRAGTAPTPRAAAD